jgi:uncharacterized protein (TIGR03086 family)
VPVVDLKPAASRLADLVAAVPDDALGNPTPCSEYTVGDLLDHIHGITYAFGGAAEKATGETSSMGPQGTAANLPDDWRTAIPQKLNEMAAKWDKPQAWEGMTSVGGQGMPAEAIGVITFGELSVHGWDLAQGTGIPFDPDPAGLEPFLELTSGFLNGPNGDAMRGTAFGPAVAVPDDAPVFERALGVLGRDPHWKA